MTSYVASCSPRFEFPEEWQLWKSDHGKSYDSELEELERHITWLSNKKYIEQHNANADVLGFTLAMNHFGDLVSTLTPLSASGSLFFRNGYSNMHTLLNQNMFKVT